MSFSLSSNSGFLSANAYKLCLAQSLIALLPLPLFLLFLFRSLLQAVLELWRDRLPSRQQLPAACLAFQASSIRFFSEFEYPSVVASHSVKVFISAT